MKKYAIILSVILPAVAFATSVGDVEQNSTVNQNSTNLATESGILPEGTYKLTYDNLVIDCPNSIILHTLGSIYSNGHGQICLSGSTICSDLNVNSDPCATLELLGTPVKFKDCSPITTTNDITIMKAHYTQSYNNAWCVKASVQFSNF
jgi:hypothetical protein